jgi:Terminase large subunit, T4likevirus-type, N-terminal
MATLDRAPRLIEQLIQRFTAPLLGTDSTGPDPVRLAEAAGVPPDPWQAEVLRSRARQILLLASRQSGKSTVSALLAADEALHRPPALALLLAPALRQSQELFRKVKDALVASGTTVPIIQESALTLEMANGSRIVSLPGTEQTVRGYSNVALLVVDEAARVDDDLYHAIRPMLSVSGGRIVLLSTPAGKRGVFHREYTEGGPDWHRVRITAHQCPRISPAWLAAERGRIGERWFRQEYLCEFVDTEDQVFAYDDIMGALRVDVAPLHVRGLHDGY